MDHDGAFDVSEKSRSGVGLESNTFSSPTSKASGHRGADGVKALGRCATCAKNGHFTWHLRPPDDKLRLEIHDGAHIKIPK